MVARSQLLGLALVLLVAAASVRVEAVAAYDKPPGEQCCCSAPSMHLPIAASQWLERVVCARVG